MINKHKDQKYKRMAPPTLSVAVGPGQPANLPDWRQRACPFAGWLATMVGAGNQPAEVLVAWLAATLYMGPRTEWVGWLGQQPPKCGTCMKGIK